MPNIFYWCGRTETVKAGQCGTYDGNQLPPDTDATSKAVYDEWVAAYPAPTVGQRIIKLKKVSDGTVTEYEDVTGPLGNMG